MTKEEIKEYLKGEKIKDMNTPEQVRNIVKNLTKMLSIEEIDDLIKEDYNCVDCGIECIGNTITETLIKQRNEKSI